MTTWAQRKTADLVYSLDAYPVATRWSIIDRAHVLAAEGYQMDVAIQKAINEEAGR